MQNYENIIAELENVLAELATAKSVRILGSRVVEIAGSEKIAEQICAILILDGAAMKPKYFASNFDLEKTPKTELYNATNYYRNKLNEIKTAEDINNKQYEKLILEIADLKKKRWQALTALTISIINIFAQILYAILS